MRKCSKDLQEYHHTLKCLKYKLVYVETFWGIIKEFAYVR